MTRCWIIGSRPECDLMVDRPTVSGSHCRLSQDDGGFSLEDLGSLNGTFVNGTRMAAGTAVRVRRGDLITLGPAMPFPWPPEVASAGARILRIGREPDNDVVVNSPNVSAHHARIVWEGPPAEVIIEDLASSNGTALGAPDRRTARAVLSASDTVFLGTHPIAATQLLWRLDPSLVPTVSFGDRPIVVGRNSDCDHVIDAPMVSGRHARLIRSEGQTWVEDLGSANGTYVNGQRVDRSTLQSGDLISLGTYMLVFDGEPRTAVRSEKAATQVISSVTPALPSPSHVGQDTGWSWRGAFVGECSVVLSHPWRLVALLAQAPVLALLIVLVLKVGPEGPALTARGWTEAGRTVAAVLFWLGLAAVWFGLSNAVLGLPSATVGKQRDRRAAWLAARFAALGALGVVQCVLAWLFVAHGTGLKGPGLPMLALLVMASAVGLALGLAVVALSPRAEAAGAVLPLFVLLLWLFGGEYRPSPRMAPWVRPVAVVVPSRWAFEGLLLLESDQYPWQMPNAPAPDQGTSELANNDLAQAYFPADSERMGLSADVTALAAMLVALLASAAFVAAAPRAAS